jgi:hypothetical protein
MGADDFTTESTESTEVHAVLKQETRKGGKE